MIGELPGKVFDVNVLVLEEHLVIDLLLLLV